MIRIRYVDRPHAPWLILIHGKPWAYFGTLHEAFTTARGE